MPTSLSRFLLALGMCTPVLASEKSSWSPELSMQVETIDTVVPSPSGAWVAYTRTRAVMETERSEMVTQIFVARTDGSAQFQLTNSSQSASSPAFSPDSRHVYFLSRRAERPNIWRISLSGGEAQAVTDWEGNISGYRVSPDGLTIAFSGRTRDEAFDKARKERLDFRIVGDRPKGDDLWVVTSDVGGGERRPPKRIFDRENHVQQFEWSHDGKQIVVEVWPGREPDYWLQSDILELDVESGDVRVLADDKLSERSPRYSPDGKRLAYVSSSHLNNWAREGRLVIVDRATGDRRTLPVTRDEFGRGSNLLGFSADSQQILFTETQGTRNVLMTMTLGGKQRTLGHATSGTLSNYGRGSRLNQTGSHVGLARESSSVPVEAFAFSVADERFRKVTDAHRDLQKPPLGRTESIRWTSKDGTEVEGLLTYPVGYSRGTRVPLVLVIHGGPMGVFTETFIGARGLYPVATFAAKGYAVLRPNPRGSSGYGKEFRMANISDWGGGDYEDIMSGVDRAIDMGVADPQQLAVMGWSYGGFMTSWVIGHTDRFRAACVGAAVTNLWSFTGTSDILDFLPGYFEGEPWEVFDAYRNHSPMSYVQNVKTPALVLHGEQDLRVPISQGYEFYNALSRRGVETQMVVYPRTPHGPREPKFLLDVAKRHVEWVEQHLK